MGRSVSRSGRKPSAMRSGAGRHEPAMTDNTLALRWCALGSTISDAKFSPTNQVGRRTLASGSAHRTELRRLAAHPVQAQWEPLNTPGQTACFSRLGCSGAAWARRVRMPNAPRTGKSRKELTAAKGNGAVRFHLNNCMATQDGVSSRFGRASPGCDEARSRRKSISMPGYGSAV